MSSFSKFNNMKNLADDILARHGIKRQVTAAMIVDKAQRFFADTLPVIAKNQVRVISYQENILKVGAINASARFVAAQHDQTLEDELIKTFPSMHLEKIIHVIDPSIADRLIQ